MASVINSKLHLAEHPTGEFQNKQILHGGKIQAANAIHWKVTAYDITSMRMLKRVILNMLPEEVVIDSTPKEDAVNPMRLSGDNFNNTATILVLDLETSDTLPDNIKVRMTYDEVILFVREKLKYDGTFLITSSSRYELTGEPGWHVYIPLNGEIDRSILQRWVEMKMSQAKALYIGTNSSLDSMPASHKRCIYTDITIYTAARKIFEAAQIMPTEGREKIVEIVKAVNGAGILKLSTIKMGLNNKETKIEYQLHPETAMKQEQQKQNSIKRIGAAAYNKKLYLREHGLISNRDKLHTKEYGEITVAACLRKKKDIPYYAEGDNHVSGTVYYNQGIMPLVVDHHSGIKYRIIKSSDELLPGKYIPKNFISKNKPGMYAAPPGSGKTTSIENLGKKVLIVIKTRVQAKQVAEDKGYTYIEALSQGGTDRNNDWVLNEGVYVCTYKKYEAMYRHIPDEIVVVVDEAHNLLLDTTDPELMIFLLKKVAQKEIYAITGTPILGLGLLDPIRHLKRGGNPLNINICHDLDWHKLMPKHDRWLIYIDDKPRGELIADWLSKNGHGDAVVISAEHKVNAIHGKNVVTTSAGKEGIDIFFREGDESISVGILCVDADPYTLVQVIGRVRDLNTRTDSIYIATYGDNLRGVGDDRVKVKAQNSSFMEQDVLERYRVRKYPLLEALSGVMTKIVQEFIKAHRPDAKNIEYLLMRLGAQYAMQAAKSNLSLFIQCLEWWGNYTITQRDDLIGYAVHEDGSEYSKTKHLVRVTRIKADIWEEVEREYGKYISLSDEVKAEELAAADFSARQKKEFDRYVAVISVCRQWEQSVDKSYEMGKPVPSELKLHLYQSVKRRKLVSKHLKLLSTGVYEDLKSLLSRQGFTFKDGVMSVSRSTKLKKVTEVLRSEYPGIKKDITYLEVLAEFGAVSEDRKSWFLGVVTEGLVEEWLKQL